MPVKDEPFTHTYFPSSRPEVVLLALKAAAYDSLARHLEHQPTTAHGGCDEHYRARLLARVYRAAADEQSSGAVSNVVD